MIHKNKEINAERLFELLRSISKYLDRKIKMYSLGGTALTILNLKKSTLDIEKEIENPNMKAHGELLKQNWHGMKPCLAVASGGLHPGHVPKLIKLMGNDVQIQAGGGIFAHPSGGLAGARALRQSVEATMQKIPLRTYAKTHPELAAAIKRWGIPK